MKHVSGGHKGVSEVYWRTLIPDVYNILKACLYLRKLAVPENDVVDTPNENGTVYCICE
jgi:hypothetical protein